MTRSFDLLLKGGTVVNQDGEGVRDLGIAGGRIAAIGDLAQAAAGEVIDCRGLHVLPGVIDTQVHFRDPGLTHKEDLETGSRSAVMGGVTAVFEMPNTNPTTTDAAALAAKVASARHRMHCDFAFFIGGTRENTRELGELERLPGCAGVKVFMGSSTGSLLVEDDEGVRNILKAIRRRASFHSEDEYRLNERKPLRVEGDPRSHPVWRDEQAALQCTQRLVGLARETGKRVHVLHITTAQEMEFLKDHKDVASVEVTPHHLTLDGARLLRAPRRLCADEPAGARRQPIARRSGAPSTQGIVDVLGSDHAPHTREEKTKAYPASPSGMTGVQTLVPIMLDHVNAGRLTPDAPGRSHQRRAGAPVRHRPQGPHRARATTPISRWSISSGARPSPIAGSRRAQAGRPMTACSVTGWPVGTVVRGHRVMWEGELTAPARGEAVEFLETMAAR